MLNFVVIEKHASVGVNGSHVYYSVTDAKRNKNWIVQYNTTLLQMVHYALGYTEALNLNYVIYFHESVPQHELDQALGFCYGERITEKELKRQQDILKTVG